jgi:polar amino acid transport system substrate-binding protein
MPKRYLLSKHGLWFGFIWVLVNLAGFPFLSFAAQPEPSASQLNVHLDQGLLRVGISSNAPPLAFKQGAALVGAEPELAKALANHLGKKIQFVELKWEEQIPALLARRTDIIMSGMTITSMRKVRIAFSQPYFRTGQMALIHEKVRDRFPQSYYGILAQAVFLKIGVAKGTTGEQFVRQDFSTAKKIIAYDTSNLAITGLKKGEIDLYIHDAPIILWLASENETQGLAPLPSLMTEEYLAWGIRKEDEELLKAANQFIDQMRQQKKLQEILYRWIPFLK